MDGHWEWSDSGDEPDTGDTADLGGEHTDPGYGQGFGQGYGETGFDGHDDFSAGDGGDAHAVHGGHDDLEEPLGTEHAAEDYDESVHDTHDTHDTQDAHDGQFEDADGDPAQHAQFEPLTGQHTDVDGLDVGADGAAEPFGSDPDLHSDADSWPEPTFPEELHLDGPPEPVDGFPWTDADVLGGPEHAELSVPGGYDPAGHAEGGSPADLAAYDGAGVPAGADPWAPLLTSDDPATSSLAGFWAPHS